MPKNPVKRARDPVLKGLEWYKSSSILSPENKETILDALNYRLPDIARIIQLLYKFKWSDAPKGIVEQMPYPQFSFWLKFGIKNDDVVIVEVAHETDRKKLDIVLDYEYDLDYIPTTRETVAMLSLKTEELEALSRDWKPDVPE
jgi:hypothetical protein